MCCGARSRICRSSASCARIFSSAILRSSISILEPYHLTISPASLAVVLHDEGTSDIPRQPAALATRQRKALRLRGPSAIWAQSFLHLQDGSCRSNPTPVNLLKGGRHIPASRGCRSRPHHSATRCETAPE